MVVANETGSQIPRLLTCQQAAEILQCSVHAVRRWISMGLLPAHRIGQALVRIRAEDLIRFTESRHAKGQLIEELKKKPTVK